MIKLVINTCYGGFSLSRKACEELGVDGEYGYRDALRNDPRLVEIVERLGEEANGDYADLRVVEIPENVEWTIEEYDGSEWIAEKHRTWG